MERVVKLAVSSNYQVRKEAIWTLANVVISGKDRNVQCLVQVDGIRGLCAGLELSRESKLLLTALEAFEKLMDIDEACGRNYRLIMEEYGGIERLEDLQLHPNDDVYEKANSSIRRMKLMRKLFHDRKMELLALDCRTTIPHLTGLLRLRRLTRLTMS